MKRRKRLSSEDYAAFGIAGMSLHAEELKGTDGVERTISLIEDGLAQNDRESLIETAKSVAGDVKFLSAEEKAQFSEVLATRTETSLDTFLADLTGSPQAILKRGRIRNDDEYRLLTSYADFVNDEEILTQIWQVLDEYG